MSWWNPGTWGLVIEWRKRKEKRAIDHLRRALQAEKGRMDAIIAVVGEMEVAINNGDFPAAERLVPSLAKALEQKAAIDKLEKIDWNVFKKSMLRDLQAQVRGLK